MGVPPNGWFVRENPNLKLDMISRGTMGYPSDSGNHHFFPTPRPPAAPAAGAALRRTAAAELVERPGGRADAFPGGFFEWIWWICHGENRTTIDYDWIIQDWISHWKSSYTLLGSWMIGMELNESRDHPRSRQQRLQPVAYTCIDVEGCMSLKLVIVSSNSRDIYVTVMLYDIRSVKYQHVI